MRILVTGAAGFIGAHLSRKLLQSGHDLILCDKYSPYYSVDLKKRRAEALLGDVSESIYPLDLSDASNIEKMVNGALPQAVIHLGAQPGVRLKAYEYDNYLRDNVASFNNVLNTLSKYPDIAVLYASSSSVYDDSLQDSFHEQNTLINPKSYYGLTKKWNEEQAKHFSSKLGLRTRGLRFFTVYGPWGRPDMAYFRLVASALGQYKFTLFGDGTVKRDFTFIDDVCLRIESSLSDLLRQSSGFADVVNIGGQAPHSMLDLIKTIESVTQKKIEYFTGEKNDLDLRSTEADKSYGNSIFGDIPYKTLDAGIKEFYNWAERPQIKSKLKEWIMSVK